MRLTCKALLVKVNEIFAIKEGCHDCELEVQKVKDDGSCSQS
jgi:hypothetical protein